MSKINKIFLFGATGMLGNYIFNYFSNDLSYNIKIIKIPFRISSENIEKLEEVLIQNNIDDETCVINCIGMIPQRKESNISDSVYFLVNSIFPNVLWQICKKYNSKMIQPTTDCVFSGKKINGGYTETDIHDEKNAYGMSKSLGEPLGCTVIRSSIIGCELYNKKSFLEWVLNSIKDNKQIQGWDNHYWNGITCLQYCKVIEKIIIDNNFWKGIRHIYSPSKKSKYELASMIIEVFYGKDKLELLSKYSGVENIDKTLNSEFNEGSYFNIPELYVQIKELKTFVLI